MALAKVWNDNVHPHTEVFKGETLHIPAHGFITMDWDEAKQFEGQFHSIRKNADGITQDPKSFKRIRLELVDALEPVRVPLVCHATGKLAKDEAELKAMNAQHVDSLDGDSKKQVEELAAKDAEIEALKAQLAASQVKRGGRPKKVQTEEVQVDGL